MSFITSWFTKLTKGELRESSPTVRKPIWVIDESKFLGNAQVNRLRRYCLQVKEEALADPKGRFCRLRDWFMVELGLFTGLRVGEMTRLRVGDLNIRKDEPSLIVRVGKGGKSRVIHFGPRFKTVCALFLEIKKSVGQPLEEGIHVLTSASGKPLSKRALQKSFKRCLTGAGLNQRYGIHCLRHTYGTHLYRASGYNLRLVQQQLGHASVHTTQIYASLFNEDATRAVERLYRP